MDSRQDDFREHVVRDKNIQDFSFSLHRDTTHLPRGEFRKNVVAAVEKSISLPLESGEREG
ncbi:MAG: hypothetical protein HXS52_03295 [Theionarchaea archaeon]|nr:hypothetical protein [Theionarchaea archaeon]